MPAKGAAEQASAQDAVVNFSEYLGRVVATGRTQSFNAQKGNFHRQVASPGLRFSLCCLLDSSSGIPSILTHIGNCSTHPESDVWDLNRVFFGSMGATNSGASGITL